MNLDTRGDALVLMDLPPNFTLPEHFPVTWNSQLKAFSIPRRHATVRPLLEFLVKEGHLSEIPSGIGRGASVRRESHRSGASRSRSVRAAA